MSRLETVKEQVKGELTLMNKPDFLDLVDNAKSIEECYEILDLARDK